MIKDLESGQAFAVKIPVVLGGSERISEANARALAIQQISEETGLAAEQLSAIASVGERAEPGLENLLFGFESFAMILDRVVESSKKAKDGVENLEEGTVGADKKFQKLSETVKEFTIDFNEIFLEGARQTVIAVTEGMADQFAAAFISFVDGSKSASEAFREFAVSLVTDIGFIIVKLLALAGILAVLNLIPGFAAVLKALDLFTVVPGLQDGGIVKKPTLAMIGEAGPEAVIPLDQMGGEVPEPSAQAINVTLNINAVDARSFEELVSQNPDSVVRVFQEALATSIPTRDAIRTIAAI
jgi:hypothetical protein